MDFEYYRQQRNALIDDLDLGLLKKTDFIKAQTALYIEMDIKEPKCIQGTLDGLFYYQYYNTLAKHHQILYRDLKYKDPFVAVDHRKTSDKLYAIKERITYRLLCAIDFQGIEAYYVKATSKQLKYRLVEIVLVTEEKAILHSLDPQVITALKSRGLLDSTIKESIIDSYINKPYYKV